jgi:hypothetical protein
MVSFFCYYVLLTEPYLITPKTTPYAKHIIY